MMGRSRSYVILRTVNWGGGGVFLLLGFPIGALLALVLEFFLFRMGPWRTTCCSERLS